VAEETGVRMALHPNDPPLACMAGIPSLIYNMECYRKAFKAAGGSKALGIKLCVGCWLEGGSDFGDLMSDIKELCDDGSSVSTSAMWTAPCRCLRKCWPRTATPICTPS
jgi:mannonate dehydratase